MRTYTRRRYRSDTGFFPVLDKAWRKLKKVKIYGKRGSCCRGCSVSEASGEIDEKELTDYVGCVHYNVQDREGMKFDPEKGMYLGFFANTEVDEDEETTEKLAFAVAMIAKLHFEAHGFEVEWNGSTGTRLLLRLKEDS